MQAADPATLYFDRPPSPVLAVMRRVGVRARADEFIAAVVDAWRAVQHATDAEVAARFRAGRPYGDFRALLGSVRASTVLVLGCGRGLGGRSSGYAASVTREVLPGARIDCLDLTPLEAVDASPGYELVVSHSLVHFLHDPAPLCRLVCGMVAPGGAYLMANEPNFRFWSNPECVAAMRQVSEAERRAARWRRWLSPKRYWSRLRRVGSIPSPDPAARINALLLESAVVSGQLSYKEIVRLVDPFLPDTLPGESSIGADGLNWMNLKDSALFGFTIENVRTSRYVKDNPDSLPRRWRELESHLAARYPQDGFAVSILWRRSV